MKSLVSVVVPVYNVEQYLDRCVESIVSQTYSNLEIFLIDDGSSDNSSYICDLWAEKDGRIKVIHKENEGAGFARNTGIENAEGNYILFVDSDDYLDATTVEKCVSVAQKNGSDIVMFGRNDVFPNGKIKNKSPANTETYFKKDEILNDIFPGLFTYSHGIGVSVWGKMFDLSIINLNNIRFKSEREIISEDAFFLLELFAFVDSLSIIPESLYFYYKNDNSFSRKYKKNHQKLNDNFLIQGQKVCVQLNYPQKVFDYLIARYHTYSLVGMKQIFMSDLSKSEKKKELTAIYRNEVLRNTLTRKAVGLAIPQSRIFWNLYKMRLYKICSILLWYKSKKH